MPRLSFKPDASFFRKIVVGAVGARAVVADLAPRGHQFIELERGSTDTKLWKEVKRKRVRIPDLLCLRCGTRIECRAKTDLELAMSHSPTDAERAWDFGMVDSDWVAFPVCKTVAEDEFSVGALRDGVSYWRQKNWVKWQCFGTVNYFTVAAFRSELHAKSRTKGVEEGSENVIAWDATFSTRDGVVERVAEEGGVGKVTVRRDTDGHRCTWRITGQKRIVVSAGQHVGCSQVLASAVPPLPVSDLRCSGSLPPDFISRLLASRERTLRFTGVKLARLLGDAHLCDRATNLANDGEEDVYVRLEAVSYLSAVCGKSARALFTPYLASGDEQTQLEAVVALGESANEEAVAILSEFLGDSDQPYFLRSAAAWALSRTRSHKANQQLVRAFTGVDSKLREEALDGLAAIGEAAYPTLLRGLRNADENIAAGCAEALRRAEVLPGSLNKELAKELSSEQPKQWAVWLVGHLPREHFAAAIAQLQEQKPELHYAISLLWSFVDSWISRNWELRPTPHLPCRRSL
jgi:hypothetical protein